jgi:hypothetical protein
MQWRNQAHQVLDSSSLLGHREGGQLDRCQSPSPETSTTGPIWKKLALDHDTKTGEVGVKTVGELTSA